MCHALQQLGRVLLLEHCVVNFQRTRRCRACLLIKTASSRPSMACGTWAGPCMPCLVITTLEKVALLAIHAQPLPPLPRSNCRECHGPHCLAMVPSQSVRGTTSLPSVHVGYQSRIQPPAALRAPGRCKPRPHQPRQSTAARAAALPSKPWQEAATLQVWGCICTSGGATGAVAICSRACG